MIIQTLQFGELNVQQDQLIRFEQGLPGFESLRQFLLLTPDPEIPFSFLQSIEDGDIAFVLTDPFLFYPNYEFDLSEDTQGQLSIEQEQDVIVWAIVSLQEDMTKSTLNLLAPVVINEIKRLGKQCILHGSEYTTKHPLSVADVAENTVEEGDAHARIDS